MSISQNVDGSGHGEVSNCVFNLIHAFTNGLNIFKRLRRRRRKRKGKDHKAQVDPSSGAELQLSNSLRRGPADIQDSYEKHYSMAGGVFAKGDSIAHASLAGTLIKLNTGLVAIIAAFLERDSKPNQLSLDYKSLTHLSEASRADALESMAQLYQRLSQSQLQIHRTGACPRCGSMKHHNCSETVAANSTMTDRSSSDKKKHRGTRSRTHGPVVARVAVKSSNSTQLAMVRPRNTRKGSSSSSGSSTKSQSTAPSSPYASPMDSPLPAYTPIDAYPPQPHHQPPAPTTRRRAASIDGPRPTTWPHTRPDTTPLPAPLPPPKSLPVVKPHYDPPLPPASPTPRRRTDKVTPSTYTFASDSTKLGEIPQRNWTTPWNYEEAERLNAEALASGYGGVAPVESRPKAKKGIFRFLRRGADESG
ncbi:hypothetical protein EJ04DRAFT_574248 [Polyplosphaeria fusca]|uniref:Uncharacterized protein n=1 Tax=Polyplosphaeria fusca TaxID=682080 RepID=A0A9P4R250_9PLEO|nr:hypothetical protein EJ04DRAFT_574248 [Polyplosphaeria fusca]